MIEKIYVTLKVRSSNKLIREPTKQDISMHEHQYFRTTKPKCGQWQLT